MLSSLSLQIDWRDYETLARGLLTNTTLIEIKFPRTIRRTSEADKFADLAMNIVERNRRNHTTLFQRIYRNFTSLYDMDRDDACYKRYRTQ